MSNGLLSFLIVGGVAILFVGSLLYEIVSMIMVGVLIVLVFLFLWFCVWLMVATIREVIRGNDQW